MIIRFPGINRTFTSDLTDDGGVLLTDQNGTQLTASMAYEHRAKEGSLNISKALCATEDLTFGACNASRAEVVITDVDDVTGQIMTVSQRTDGYGGEIPRFYGIVESAELQPDHSSRKIVAYDALYSYRDRELTSWYKSLFSTTLKSEYKGEWNSTARYTNPSVVLYDSKYYRYICSAEDYVVRVEHNVDHDHYWPEIVADEIIGMTPEEIYYDPDYSKYIQVLMDYDPNDYGPTTFWTLRNALFDHVGIRQTATDLINDDLEIHYVPGAFWTFGSLISAICEANACFGHMSDEGTFQYIYLGTTPEDITDNVRSSTTYAEYACDAIDKVVIVGADGSTACEHGTGDNPWEIDNPLLYGSDVETAAARLYDIANAVTYYPAVIQSIFSLPLSLGEKVTFTTVTGDTVTSYVLQDAISGRQCINQTITARGSRQRKSTKDVISALENRLNSMGVALQDYGNFRVAVVKELSARTATVESLRVYQGYIDRLMTDDLTAQRASITELSGDYLEFKTGTIGELAAHEAVIDSLSTTYATITNLNATNARVTALEAEDVTINGKITAAEGRIGTLEAADVTITGRLSAAEADIDTLEATSATVTQLNATNARIDNLGATYATIDLANVTAGSITTAMIGTGVVGTAQIADGSVTDAKIVGLSANKITAGTIDAGTISVINLDAANITVGTINGTQICNGAIDVNKLSSSLQDTIDATITSVVVLYANGTSETTAPSSGWSETAPAWEDGKYMWQKTVTTYTDGTVETSDATCLTGATGSGGSPGPAGPAGNGISSITYHYATTTTQTAPAASSVTSTTIPTLSATNKYLWQKETIVYTNSGTADKVTVALIAVYGDKGNQGDPGQTGATGNGISSITYYYATTTTQTTPSASSVTGTTIPALSATNKYLWQKEVIAYTNNTNKTTVLLLAVYGDKGDAGKGISSTTITYGKSSSATTEPSSWGSSVPTLAQGDWLWVKTVITYTDNTNNTTYQKSYIGTDGDDGTSVFVQSATKSGDTTTVVIADSEGHTNTLTIVDGADGDDGQPGANGLNGYVHTAWANSADGGTDFSTSVSTGKQYLGVYTDNTAADSQTYTDYSWSKIKGEQGATGATGNGISSITYHYATTTTQTAPAAANVTSTTIPTLSSTNKYLWQKETIAYTAAGSTNKVTVALIAVYGDKGVQGDPGQAGSDGNGISSITYYYATTTTQSAPSASSITGTTIPTMSATNKYLWQKEVISYTGTGVSPKTSVLLLAVYGDKGDTGNTGVGVDDLVTQYYLSTSDGSPTGGSWSTTVPEYETGKYYWTRDYITWTDGTHSTTSPVLSSGLNEAITTARSKTRVYHTDTAPHDGDLIAGDTWFDTSDGYKMYRSTGTQYLADENGNYLTDENGNYLTDNGWTEERFSTSAIAASAITTSLLAAGCVTADKIVAEAITTDKLAARSITANKIAVGAITATEIAAGTIKANNIDISDVFAQTITATGTISGAVIHAAENSTIGDLAKAYVSVVGNSIEMYYGSETAPYVQLCDLRDANGHTELSERFIGDGTTTSFEVSHSVYSVGSVKVGGSTTSAYTRSGTTFTLTTAPAMGTEIDIIYTTADPLKAFTFGYRSTALSETTGCYSFAVGKNVTGSGEVAFVTGEIAEANGKYSVAHGFGAQANGNAAFSHGYYTKAEGDYSTAEGSQTTAYHISHAEGYNTYADRISHAEGDSCIATGSRSHAEGSGCQATGHSSHAQNAGTLAGSTAQTAIGFYNSADYLDKYLFIIGNGTDNTHRSNALTVDWDGTIESDSRTFNNLVSLPGVSYEDLSISSSATRATFLTAYVKYLCQNIIDTSTMSSKTFIGRIVPNSAGFVILTLYGAVNSSNMPQYGSIIAINMGGGMTSWSINNYSLSQM